MSFFPEYFQKLNEKLNDLDISLFNKASDIILETRKNGGKVIIVGNGGSAAIATHISVDLSKCGIISAMSFNEAGLITCYANDYGYEEWVARAFDTYGKNNDLAILISSSGCSMNIINAAKKARDLGMKVMTFSGFEPDNPLRQLGDINFWINSRQYNIVEMTHNVWLCSIIDYLDPQKP